MGGVKYTEWSRQRLTVQFTKGQPKIFRVILDFRHGKRAERQAALALLPRMREKYEEETLSLQ